MINIETVVVSALSGLGGSGLAVFLGRKWVEHRLNKSLEAFKTDLNKELDIIRHELSLVLSSFERNIEHVFDYYSIYYKYYRLCQKITLIDFTKTKEGAVINTKDIFLDDLDQIVKEWSQIEGRMRLILPNEIIVKHDKSVIAFNSVRDLVKSYESYQEKPREELESKFKELDNIKNEMELALKEYLRSEKIY